VILLRLNHFRTGGFGVWFGSSIHPSCYSVSWTHEVQIFKGGVRASCPLFIKTSEQDTRTPSPYPYLITVGNAILRATPHKRR
jgi:hypothetical protein